MAQKCLRLPGLASPLPDDSLLSFLLAVDCYHSHSVLWGSLALALQLSLVQVVPVNSPAQHPFSKWVDLSCHPHPSKVSLSNLHSDRSRLYSPGT